MGQLKCIYILRRYSALISCSPRHATQSTRALSTTSTRWNPSTRTYADALSLLDTLQSNRTIVSDISRAHRDMNLDAIPQMLEWTRKAGYTPEQFAEGGLNFIHVAGTKGKGSTCTMIEKILLEYQQRPNGGPRGRGLGKVGLYTSPHLVTVRERIRIDGSPISENLFAQGFFELWDRFTRAAADVGHPAANSWETRPGYFRYLTLLALHVFVTEKVESAIIECGIGGEYDSTNILPAQAITVSAITKLGIDHTGMLGQTIGKIAWHKAGIMRSGVPAFTVEQDPAAQEVLEARSEEKGVVLKVIPRMSQLQTGEIRLGMDGEHQKDNASLAIAVAQSHLKSLGIHEEASQGALEPRVPERFVQALTSAKMLGRWQTIKQGNIEWCIDGAHTEDSLQATADWFQKKTLSSEEPNPPTATMLIFNQQERDAKALLRVFLTRLYRGQRPGAGRAFTYAAFCTNEPFTDRDGKVPDVTKQEELAKLYQVLEGNSLNMVSGSIQEAVEMAKRVSSDDGDRLLVLVTGSLHLVGGLLSVLERESQQLT